MYSNLRKSSSRWQLSNKYDWFDNHCLAESLLWWEYRYSSLYFRLSWYSVLVASSLRHINSHYQLKPCIKWLQLLNKQVIDISGKLIHFELVILHIIFYLLHISVIHILEYLSIKSFLMPTSLRVFFSHPNKGLIILLIKKTLNYILDIVYSEFNSWMKLQWNKKHLENANTYTSI